MKRSYFGNHLADVQETIQHDEEVLILSKLEGGLRRTERNLEAVWTIQDFYNDYPVKEADMEGWSWYGSAEENYQEREFTGCLLDAYMDNVAYFEGDPLPSEEAMIGELRRLHHVITEDDSEHDLEGLLIKRKD